MTWITSILTSGWEWVAGIAAAAVALIGVYFCGKKIGTVQTQAKADVAAAEKEQKQAEQATTKQAEIVKAVNDVEQENNSLSDTAARERMRNSKYYADD